MTNVWKLAGIKIIDLTSHDLAVCDKCVKPVFIHLSPTARCQANVEIIVDTWLLQVTNVCRCERCQALVHVFQDLPGEQFSVPLNLSLDEL